MKSLFMSLIFACSNLLAQDFDASLFKRLAARVGGESGGGGDLKVERRIKDIRDDILDWINDGGVRKLSFNKDISYNDYIHGNVAKKVYSMLDVLTHGAVAVSVFNKSEEDLTDSRLNTYVYGSPKVCKGYIENDIAYIVCSKEKFESLNEHEQYQQIHHEYASLARLEQNIGSDSDYRLSKQLVAFLEYQQVLKLTVKKNINLVSYEGRYDAVGVCAIKVRVNGNEVTTQSLPESSNGTSCWSHMTEIVDTYTCNENIGKCLFLKSNKPITQYSSRCSKMEINLLPSGNLEITNRCQNITKLYKRF